MMRHAEPCSHVHVPLSQVLVVPEQDRPHEPQLSGLELVLMHEPLQQLSEPPQVRPHAPQFATLALVSAHAPLQQAWVPTHPGPLPQWHVPPVHVSPTRHAGLHGMSLVHEPARHA